ncbi:SRS domain-containing protein [Neospora caninum Liverpool]|uniref:SRS domain-containing protein n=1 Tax=Neospora caninum (strain Liverpool) TaxID=572307 RepID=F0VL98_NEOCL|nr:SRS domain-containing protein [Neospora caninum Liverpool]CBZ54850.1 SRS domain-containing protein [Neospora caninum Liverpool]CEL69569.1 TPA: SRS domain-containing protein [Neospora caninum Liverpool]|eukprot:XP_003884878.1 SRS domain-containing protein [Neospora caninum Liverpool]
MAQGCPLSMVSCWHLAFLVAGVLLEPSSSHASSSANSSSTTVRSCDTVEKAAISLEGELLLTLPPDEKSVSFKCSSKAQTTLEPPDQKNVYNEEDCSNAVPLQSLFASATLDEEKNNQHEVDAQTPTYKLTVPSESRTTNDTVLYYKCKLPPASGSLHAREIPGVEAGKECKVKITVVGVPPKDQENEQIEEQQTSIIECASANATEEASVSAESPLSFKCGAGMSLHPTALTDVYNDRDGKCTPQVTLQSLVDATLEQAGTDAPENEQPVYQLAVKTAPSEDTALCYKCVPSSSSNEKGKTASGERSTGEACLLKISVKGSASSASAKWGAPEEGVAFFVGVQILFALFCISM